MPARGLTARLWAGDASSSCHLRDISAGGAFVRCPRTMPVGTRVALEVKARASPNTVPLTGRVVRSVPPDAAGLQAGIAVEFAPLTPEAALNLARILRALGLREPKVRPEWDGEVRSPLGSAAEASQEADVQRLRQQVEEAREQRDAYRELALIEAARADALRLAGATAGPEEDREALIEARGRISDLEREKQALEAQVSSLSQALERTRKDAQAAVAALFSEIDEEFKRSWQPSSWRQPSEDDCDIPIAEEEPVTERKRS